MNKLEVYGIDITRILEGKVRTWIAKGGNTENGELEVLFSAGILFSAFITANHLLQYLLFFVEHH